MDKIQQIYKALAAAHKQIDILTKDVQRLEQELAHDRMITANIFRDLREEVEILRRTYDHK